MMLKRHPLNATFFLIGGLLVFLSLFVLFGIGNMQARGPDANPVAGIQYFTGLVIIFGGILAAVCSIAVIRSFFRIPQPPKR